MHHHSHHHYHTAYTTIATNIAIAFMHHYSINCNKTSTSISQFLGLNFKTALMQLNQKWIFRIAILVQIEFVPVSKPSYDKHKNNSLESDMKNSVRATSKKKIFRKFGLKLNKLAVSFIENSECIWCTQFRVFLESIIHRCELLDKMRNLSCFQFLSFPLLISLLLYKFMCHRILNMLAILLVILNWFESALLYCCFSTTSSAP